MNKLQQEQNRAKELVANVVLDKDSDSFSELEGLAKPLLINLSSYFSSLHEKFEFDDFYSICLNALYQSCLIYNPKNPSFLSYTKSIMLRQCWRELEYWNADMRNIFKISETDGETIKKEDVDRVSLNMLREKSSDVEDEIIKDEFRGHIDSIISQQFDEKKAEVLRLYIIHDMRPIDISIKTGLHYKNTHSIITRGLAKITKEYNLKFLDKESVL